MTSCIRVMWWGTVGFLFINAYFSFVIMRLILQYAVWMGCRISSAGPFPCTILGVESGEWLYGMYLTYQWPFVVYTEIMNLRYVVKLLVIIGLVIETRANKQYLSILVTLFLLCSTGLL